MTEKVNAGLVISSFSFSKNEKKKKKRIKFIGFELVYHILDACIFYAEFNRVF